MFGLSSSALETIIRLFSLSQDQVLISGEFLTLIIRANN